MEPVLSEVSEEEIARVLQSELAERFGFTREQCIEYILASRKRETVLLPQTQPVGVEDSPVICYA